MHHKLQENCSTKHYWEFWPKKTWQYSNQTLALSVINNLWSSRIFLQYNKELVFKHFHIYHNTQQKAWEQCHRRWPEHQCDDIFRSMAQTVRLAFKVFNCHYGSKQTNGIQSYLTHMLFFAFGNLPETPIA